MIEAKSISKRRGDTLALDNVSLYAAPGAIHGLIGADGAGKTTLFDILVTLVRPDSGSALVSGYDIATQWRDIRKTVGYMPAVFSLYSDLSVRENLEFFARVYRQPVRNIRSLVGDIWAQIEPFSDRPAAKLSGGMKQKLALCCTMIHDPEVLMLDEPTTGVDPVSRSEFWAALRKLADKGKTILVSTSYMDEAAGCDRITLLHRGTVLDSLDPEETETHYQGALYEIGADTQLDGRLLALLRDWSLGSGCYSFGDRIHLSLTLPGIPVETIVGYLRGQGIDTARLSVRPVRPTVEDLFIRLASGAETENSPKADNR